MFNDLFSLFYIHQIAYINTKYYLIYRLLTTSTFCVYNVQRMYDSYNYDGIKTKRRMRRTIRKRRTTTIIMLMIQFKRKRKRSDSVPWQKSLHQQKCQKGKVTTQTTPQKSSIKQRLWTDLGRSVGVTKATLLVWLTGLRAHLPTNRNSRLIKRTHV